VNELQQIKQLRRQAHLSQTQLATKAGVSQSLIAKIEAGIINPSYAHANQILRILEQELVRTQPTAKSIAHKSVITCTPKESVREVILLMKKKSISQLPVLDNEKVVGLVTEKNLLEHSLSARLEQLIVQDIMQAPPPIVETATPQEAIIALLKHTPLVLVTHQGALFGVITRTDIITRTYL